MLPTIIIVAALIILGSLLTYGLYAIWSSDSPDWLKTVLTLIIIDSLG